MPFEMPIDVKSTLDRIQSQDYVLPAIQREFVWNTGQVAALFDSLMRGYPIGSFLFWKVDAATERAFVFYDFMREYHQLKSPYCAKLDLPGTRAVTCVLDGQQRLTALNIGLRGSHAAKLPYKWASSLDAYPVKHLYLNLLAAAPENELGMEYDFQFLTEREASVQNEVTYWFPVRKVLGFSELDDAYDYLENIGIPVEKRARRTLSRLHRVVHVDKPIQYYVEEEQNLDKVLDIFIRVNRQGTPLSYSDMLLSIATAQWTDRDARDAVHDLLRDLNSPPRDFAFSQDLVLKAGLVLTEVPDFRFKVMNFTRVNTDKLDQQWDNVAQAMRLAAQLLSSFGFSDLTLSADSVLVPVSYYLHRLSNPVDYWSSASSGLCSASFATTTPVHFRSTRSKLRWPGGVSR